MQEFEITHFWMLGVMFVMFIFLGAALVGHYKNGTHLPSKRGQS